MPRAEAWRYLALQAALDAGDRLVPDRWMPSLAPDDLIAAARANPSPAAREGLHRLMAAMRKDTELSMFGRLSVRWDMIRLLRNAELVEAAHRQTPSLGEAAIVAPIIILGLPRSGTTFLHTLLAEDPANLVPRNWQTIYPAPRPPAFNAASDKRAKTVNRQLNLFAGLAPGFSALHPINADSPQECSEITAHVFQSLRFDTTFRVPDYLAWLDRHGDLEGFNFHKKFLQFLQNGQPGRWVLKCPDHTFSLAAIMQVYPDARFVIVHRDPIDVFASVAHLTEVLRKPFQRSIDAEEIGRQVSERWIEGATRLVAFDQRQDIGAARKVHLRYNELTAEPLAAVQRIYNQFNMALSGEAEQAMRSSLRARPRGGYLRHAPYSLSRFNINPQALRLKFDFYVSEYCS